MSLLSTYYDNIDVCSIDNIGQYCQNILTIENVILSTYYDNIDICSIDNTLCQYCQYILSILSHIVNIVRNIDVRLDMSKLVILSQLRSFFKIGCQLWLYYRGVHIVNIDNIY